MGINYNSNIVILLGLGLLVFLFWSIKTAMKKQPGASAGHVINEAFLKEKLTIFILSAIIINITEGFMAASITPLGETPVNPLARILSHTIVSAGGITCGLSLPINLHKLFQKETPYKIWYFIIFIFGIFGTFFLPFVNLALIANGLKQATVLELFLKDDIFFWIKMRPYYISSGLGANYSPFNHMQYVLAVSVCMTGVHYFLVLFDGLHIILTHKLDKDKEGESGSSSSNAIASGDPILKLIKFYSNGSLSTTVETEHYRLAHDVHDRMEAGPSANLASKIAEHIVKIEKHARKAQRNEETPESLKAKKIEIRKDIKSFFGATKHDGKGFGLTLPTVNYDSDPNS